MGLLFSVLVACVGVIELICFCSNVKRNLTLRPVPGDLSVVRENYIKELYGTTKESTNDRWNNDSACVVKKDLLNTERSIPTFRLNSHEDIEVEYNKKVLSKSRTPSPRRFLVTEKESKDRTEFSSPRQFVVSEEPQGIKKSQHTTSIPEFFIEEQRNSEKSPNRPRYVLKDQEGRSGSPIPLPSQFLITEKELDALECTHTSSDFLESDYDHEEYYRRSPSPYPPLDLPHTPRNSISNELVDNPIVSVVEVDEDLYTSRSSSPRNIESESKITNSNPLVPLSIDKNVVHIEKDLLAATVIERARSKSELESKDITVIHSVGSVQTVNSHIEEKVHKESSLFEDVQENFVENNSYDETYLNNLDGVSKRKFVKRNNSYRRAIKIVTVNSSIENKPFSKSNDSSVDEDTSKIWEIASEKLELPSTSAGETSPAPSTSKQPEIKKEPEPFWVNH